MIRKKSSSMARLFFGLALAMLGLYGCIPTATAAEKPVGLTVTPAQLNLTVSSERPAAEQTITLSSGYDTPVRFGAELRAIDETGAQLIPAGALDEQFANALRLSASDITIEPGEPYKLTVRVEKTAELSPGGHYAVLVLTQLGDASQIPAFRGAVAINIFTINSDGVTARLKLQDVHLPRTLFTLPSKVELDFRNDGNTHVVPRASVGIYNKDGSSLYRQALVNTNSLPLFPGKEHQFTAEMRGLETRWLPGKMSGVVMYRIDGSDIQLEHKFSFWYVPPVDIVVLLIFGAIIWFFRHRIRNIIRSTSKYIRSLYHGVRSTQKRSSVNSTKKPNNHKKRAVGRAAVQAHHATSLSAAKQRASSVFGRALVQKSTETTAKPAKKIEVKTADKPPSKKNPKPRTRQKATQPPKKKVKATTSRKKSAKAAKTKPSKKST